MKIVINLSRKEWIMKHLDCDFKGRNILFYIQKMEKQIKEKK